jgi:hypothetical protein
VLALIASFALPGQGSVIDEQLRTLIEHPTGKNGYEEYVRAVRVFEDGGAGRLARYALSLAEQTALGPAGTPPAGKLPSGLARSLRPQAGDTSGQGGGRGRGGGPGTPTRPRDVPRSATPDQVYRKALARTAPALDFVVRGNGKPVTNPRAHITSVTAFPELGGLALISRMFALKARVEFAAGNSSEGTTALLQGLKLAGKLDVSGTYSFHASFRSERSVLIELERDLSSLSPVDAHRIQAWASATAQEPSPLLAAAEVRRKQFAEDWNYLRSHPASALRMATLSPAIKDQIANGIETLPTADRTRLYHAYIEGLTAPWTSLEHVLRGPEKGWMAKVPEDDPNRRLFLTYVSSADRARLMDVAGMLSKNASLPAGNKVSSLAFVFLTLTMYQHAQSGTALADWQKLAVQSRIRRRILALTMQVAAFHRVHGRLPAKLSEAVGHEPTDAFTGKPYRYLVQPGGHFRIVCPTETIGEVSLTT